MGVTIRQIAEAAGVSRGTVDRALNNRGRIRPEVAERVRQIAEAAGQDGPGGKTSISAVVTAYRHIIWITGALGVVLT